MYCLERAPGVAIGGFVERSLLLLAALAFLLASHLNAPLLAQGLNSEEAIDAIIGSDVKEKTEAPDAVEVDRVLAAIENTRTSAEAVRKTFNLDALEIVLLPTEGEGAEQIKAALAESEDDIQLLRESIEGSAIFYHAIDSRSILLRDLVAVEFDENNSVTVFVNEPVGQ